MLVKIGTDEINREDHWNTTETTLTNLVFSETKVPLVTSTLLRGRIESQSWAYWIFSVVQEYRKLVDMLGFQVLALFDLFFIKEVSSWSKSSRRVIFVKSSREGKRQGLGPKKKFNSKWNWVRSFLHLVTRAPKTKHFKKTSSKKEKRVTNSHHNLFTFSQKLQFLFKNSKKSWSPGTRELTIDFFLWKWTEPTESSVVLTITPSYVLSRIDLLDTSISNRSMLVTRGLA